MDPNKGKIGLINKQGREELLKALQAESFSRITVSFYRYVKIKDPEILRDEMYHLFREIKVLGRIYLAKEGINAQVSIPEYNWKKFIEILNINDCTKNMALKIAVEDDGKSFIKLMIKAKEKIVSDGINDPSFDSSDVGKHLTAKEWNNFLKNKNSIIVDMRNHYESEIGHFESAILPQSETFKGELIEILEILKEKKNKKVMLYCTGGIRCEKASAYLKHHGFEDVNQLDGGIINYIRQVKAENLDNFFRGKNFVFDERLGERITDEVISECHQCSNLCDCHVNCVNKDCNLLFIQCEKCSKKMNGCCSHECKEISFLPKEIQKKRRKGKIKTGNAKRFNKTKKTLKI